MEAEAVILTVNHEFGRSWYDVLCECGARFPVYIWSYYGSGKRCPSCRRKVRLVMSSDRWRLPPKTVCRGRRYVAFICREHGHILYGGGAVAYFWEAAQKAKNCGEFEFYKDCRYVDLKLARAVLSGNQEKAAKILRGLGEEHARRLLRLAPGELDRFLSFFRRRCPQAYGDLLTLITAAKLENLNPWP